MTGLLESTVRKLSLVCAHDRSVRPFSRLRRSPRVWPFNATEKLDPAVRELLSMHCSWCVLDCDEAVCPRKADMLDRKSTRLNSSHLGISYAVFCLKKK